MKRHIPNIITLVNLFSGCLALAYIFNLQFREGAIFILIAVAADFFDGLAARALKVSSEMGKELDSLADMVSMGVVPGAILYTLLNLGLGGDPGQIRPTAFPAFLVTAFAGLRLAKFNLDLRQKEGFLGLPTPSTTLFCMGLMLIYEMDSFGWGGLVVQPGFLYTMVIALSLLMVSDLPLFSFKLKSFTWKGNEIKFIFAAVAVALLLIFREAAFSMVVTLYVLVGLVRQLFSNVQKEPS